MPAFQEAPSPVRIVVRPLASALPLGCFSFAIGNALFGAFVLHWVPASECSLLAVMLLTFVAPLEAVAGAMAFLSRDTGAATVMGIFAAAWIVQGVQLLLFGAGMTSVATAMLMGMLAICLAMLMAVTLRAKPLVGLLLGLSSLRSISACWLECGGGEASRMATALFGFAVTLTAFYCGFVFLKEDVEGKLSPLTLRRGPALQAMAGSLGEQMEHVSNEAGVRHQL